jgi:hypothetical protein
VNRDGFIRCEFEASLPPQILPNGGAQVWGRATGTVTGRADPAQAIAAFDTTRQQPFGQTSRAILDNVAGWINWALGEVFHRVVTERDLFAWLAEPSQTDGELRELLAPQFGAWSFTVEGLDYQPTLDPQAVASLPPELQARVSAGADANAGSGTPPPSPAPPGASATPAPGEGERILEHSFSGDIPAVVDPSTKNELKVRCNATLKFKLNLPRARQALDPAGSLAEDRLEREALGKAEEWYWYGVKQSFYNWIFDGGRSHRRFVRDYQLIHSEVMALCQDGLAQHGVEIQEASVRYEALDPDSAWALTAPGQSGGGPAVVPGSAPPAPQAGTPERSEDDQGSSGKHRVTPADPSVRADSQQAMAATIAIMDVNDLPVPPSPDAGGGPAAPPQPLPPIEESVWRHQKAVMKENPGLDRPACAARILERLKSDGYSVDDRKRIAGIIGGDPDTVSD